MQRYLSKNSEELSEKAAEWLVEYIHDILKKQDRFTIALSGGSTPKKLYQLLASDKYNNKIDWSKLHFFWGDERFVPFEDDRNNAKMAYADLLDRVPVKKEHIHVMQTEGLQPEESAEAYDRLLHQYFDGKSTTFDLILLGLGNDAHTLSLFPGYEHVTENKKWAVSFFLKEQDMYRITLTSPVVNMAARVAFLISGGDKAASLYHVIAGEHDPDLYPAQIIQPFNSELYWFLDEPAAADL